MHELRIEEASRVLAVAAERRQEPRLNAREAQEDPRMDAQTDFVPLRAAYKFK